MASRGKKKFSLQDVIRQGLTKGDHPLLTEELTAGTDRSSALIGCAMVDNTLVMALRSRFVAMSEEDFDSLFYSPTAPLSSFSARIKVGRAMGIYQGKLHRVMDTVRRVRNAFAHSLRPIQFADPLIVRECKKLPPAELTNLRRDGTLPANYDQMRERYLANCISVAILFEHFAQKNFGQPIEIGIPDWHN